MLGPRRSKAHGPDDLVGRQPGKSGGHQGTDIGTVGVVGRYSQAHGIDAEIADRGTQALLDRPVAVGQRTVEPGERELLGMLGGQLGIGDPAAGGIDRLGQRLMPRLVAEKPPNLSQRSNDLGLPDVAHLQDGAQPVGGQGRPAGCAQPAAEQQHVHVAATAVLQVQAGLGDAFAGVDLQREIPERVRQEIRHASLRAAEGVHGATLMSNDTDPLDVDLGAIKAKLEALRIEHRDLDDVIERLVEKPPFDQLQLQRLKKRKLGLKDQITRLESRLIPDIIA